MKVFAILAIALVVGVAGGVGYTFWKDSRKKKPLSQLLENNDCAEILDGKACKDWFLEQKAQKPDIKQGILMKPTVEWLDRLGYEEDPSVDLRFYLLQLVLDGEDNCSAYRMINYGQLSSKLADSLAADDILVFDL